MKTTVEVFLSITTKRINTVFTINNLKRIKMFHLHNVNQFIFSVSRILLIKQTKVYQEQEAEMDLDQVPQTAPNFNLLIYQVWSIEFIIFCSIITLKFLKARSFCFHDLLCSFQAVLVLPFLKNQSCLPVQMIMMIIGIKMTKPVNGETNMMMKVRRMILVQIPVNYRNSVFYAK